MRNKMKVWMCGTYFSGDNPGNINWAFNAMFFLKIDAVNSCKFRNDFIAPCKLNFDTTNTGGNKVEYMKDEGCRISIME